VLRQGRVDDVRVSDALATLIDEVGSEMETPATSPKLLPRALRWCSVQLPQLLALLRTPPPVLTARGTGERLGSHRLLVVELLTALVNAGRPPLTAALASSKPSVLCEAVRLVLAHPRCSVLHMATHRLLAGALGVRQLRATILSNAAGTGSLPAMLADAILAEGGPQLTTPALLELVAAIDQAAQADRALAAGLVAEGRWSKVTASLREYRRATAREWASGPPPPRPTAGMQAHGAEQDGEMSELFAALRQLQTQSA